MTASASPSDRTRVRRSPARADYERDTVHAILDAAWLCHVAFSDDHGVHCIPMACWREGEHLYIHGSNGSRLITRLASGTQACVNGRISGAAPGRSISSDTPAP